jgi:nucleotide-binding universal stress UspA family protein
MGLPLLVVWAGSPGSDGVVDVAADLGEMLGERVIIATVATAFGPPIFPCNGLVEDPQRAGVAASDRAHAAAQRLRDLGLEVAEVVLGGPPAAALVAEARLCSARLVIVARQDPDDEPSPILGSLVERLIHDCPCPVLVAPRSNEPAGAQVTLDLRERCRTLRRSHDHTRAWSIERAQQAAHGARAGECRVEGGKSRDR